VGPRAVLDTVVKRKIPSLRQESNPRRILRMNVFFFEMNRTGEGGYVRPELCTYRALHMTDTDQKQSPQHYWIHSSLNLIKISSVV
jgi:hypothetical protein